MKNNKFNVISEGEKQIIMKLHEQTQKTSPYLLVKSISIKKNEKEEEGLQFKSIYENEGIEGLIKKFPNIEQLAFSGYEKVIIPDSISELQNLLILTINGGAQNLPLTITKCHQLELIALTHTEAKINVSFLTKLPNLEVLNIIKSPNIIGFEALDKNPDKYLVVKE